MGNALSRDGHNYSWDSLFQALTRPDDLRDYLERTGSSSGPLRTQIELLTGTLQVDLTLLKVAEVAESFDTATFCLGQLVSHEPRMVSELPFALTFVDGLSSALRKGWLVHHGVGKFAANALTILCICEQADSAVRKRAIEELLGGLLEWLRSDEAPTEVDEVCGCNCGCPALSATCWLERLLSKPDVLLEREVANWPDLLPVLEALLTVVCRRDGNPFALTRLLRVPTVFGTLMAHNEVTVSTALDFLTFGVLQFENPMFTEDAVQALLALLRDAQLGAHVLLTCRCSLLLLEALATAACYLPSAMTALEIVADVPDGRVCLYSLAAALGAEKEASPAPAADDTEQMLRTPTTADAALHAARADAASIDSPDAAAAEAMRARAIGAGSSSGVEGGAGDGSFRSSSSSAASSPSAAVLSRKAPMPSPPSSRGSGSPAAAPAASGPASASSPSSSSSGSTPTSVVPTRTAPSSVPLPTPGMSPTASATRAGGLRANSGLLTSIQRLASNLGAQVEAARGADLDGTRRQIARWLPRRLLAPRPTRITVFAVHPTEPDIAKGAADNDDAAAAIAAALVGSSSGSGVGSSRLERQAADKAGDGDEDEDDDEEDEVVSEDTSFTGSTTRPPASAEGEPPAHEHSLEHSVDTSARPNSAAPEAAEAGEPEAGGVEAWDAFRADLPAETASGLARSFSGGRAEQLQVDNNVESSAAIAADDAPSDSLRWPTRVTGDVVKAWVVLEVAGFQQGQEARLLERMSLSDKRVWLARRLYREHHGGRVAEEDPLLFVEATREEPREVLAQIRAQYDEGVGLAGDLSATLEVTFRDENSAGSAVRREWFALVSEAFLATEARILTSTDKGMSVRPLPMLESDEASSRQLRDLQMLGRFLGLALVQQVTVAVRLHPSICRLLLRGGESWEWTHEDVEALDAELYAHKVKYVLENDVSPLCLDFTDVLHDAPAEVKSEAAAGEEAEKSPAPALSEPVRVPLVPGGEAMEVTEDNKQEFVRLVCEWRLFGSIARQVEAMRTGFEAAVPRHILAQLAQLVEPNDLARILAGEPEIDVVDWEANSVTSGGMRRGGRAYRWFWRAVRSYTPHEREQLLQFVTGSRRPPVGGFAQLQGFNGGVHLFTLCASHEPRDSLPRAHACICTVDIPEYSSYRALRRALHTALSLGSVGFDDAAVTDRDEPEAAPPASAS